MKIKLPNDMSLSHNKITKHYAVFSTIIYNPDEKQYYCVIKNIQFDWLNLKDKTK